MQICLAVKQILQRGLDSMVFFNFACTIKVRMGPMGNMWTNENGSTESWFKLQKFQISTLFLTGVHSDL